MTPKYRMTQSQMEGHILLKSGTCKWPIPCSRWFLARGFLYPEDGGDTVLRNVGSHKNYTATHPRKRHSSGKHLPANFPIQSGIK
jgi:hypothetical protein